MSILKTLDGDPSCSCRNFFEYDAPVSGIGHFIHTYSCDGDPIPSFDGEPKSVSVTGSLREYAATVWDALNEENKVALYGYERDTHTGTFDSIIINKYHSKFRARVIPSAARNL